jgi:hypothetical protein
MLYTTRKEFGISQRVFVEREWNISFTDSSFLSMSNSLPFDERVPKNAIDHLKTSHIRGVNYPGSAWIFDNDNNFTRMTSKYFNYLIFCFRVSITISTIGTNTICGVFIYFICILLQ